jgi:hypothetical protein
MSDNNVILIPEDPRLIPACEKQMHAMRTFRQLAPDSDQVEIKVVDRVRFVDCGQNFERVLCPACGKQFDFEWWNERMHEDFMDGSPLREIELPCCKAKRSLHDLRYEWPQGFALFSLHVKNPSFGKLSREQVASMEAVLGCPLRVIYQRF